MYIVFLCTCYKLYPYNNKKIFSTTLNNILYKPLNDTCPEEAHDC